MKNGILFSSAKHLLRLEKEETGVWGKDLQLAELAELIPFDDEPFPFPGCRAFIPIPASGPLRRPICILVLRAKHPAGKRQFFTLFRQNWDQEPVLEEKMSL